MQTASTEYESRRVGVNFAGAVFAMEFAREQMEEFRTALRAARAGVPPELSAADSCHHHELTDKVYQLKTHLTQSLRAVPRRLDALSDAPGVGELTVATMRDITSAWQEELEAGASEMRTLLGL